jgi:ubiquinone biosynthesis protein
MIKPVLLGRLLRIHWVLLRHGLDELLTVSPFFRHLRFLAPLTPAYWRRLERASRGERIRLALEDLGPIYVKFGQTLSTRRDLLPEDIADELAKLQDRVPPFPVEAARRIIGQELGQPVEAVFREFDDTPLASASVAQVHVARLPDGADVVVKVLRPDVEPRIRQDIALMYEFARLAQRLWPEARRLRPADVVAEFEKTILDELDLVREGANASELRRNFDNSPLLYIPKIHWPLTRRRVLVMERIYGIPIGDVARLKREGADPKLLADRGVEIFFTQVFRDSFFHADMHPGNIFVGPNNRYIAVDFGIVGTISASDQHYLAENFLAFFKRDYRRVAEMHVESGWVPPDTRVEEFESAIRAVCEPIFEKPLGEISYGHLLLRLFQTARRFNMEVQPQLMLLQKTLLNIEGLGRELYPNLDLWQTAKPFLENWFKQRVGPKAMLRKVRQRAPEWVAQTPDLPALVYRALRETADGQQARKSARELEAIREEMRRNQRRSVAAQTGSALLVCASLLWGLGKGVPLLLGAAGGFGALLLIRAWL